MTSSPCLVLDVLLENDVFTSSIQSLPQFCASVSVIKVGQDHIYMVYIHYSWQGNHQIYGVYIRFWPTLVIMHDCRHVHAKENHPRLRIWTGIVNLVRLYRFLTSK